MYSISDSGKCSNCGRAHGIHTKKCSQKQCNAKKLVMEHPRVVAFQCALKAMVKDLDPASVWMMFVATAEIVTHGLNEDVIKKIIGEELPVPETFDVLIIAHRIAQSKVHQLEVGAMGATPVEFTYTFDDIRAATQGRCLPSLAGYMDEARATVKRESDPEYVEYMRLKEKFGDK